jgi:hypothetical protein
VVRLAADLLLDGHSFNDFTKTEELIDNGRQWTEDLLGSEEGELLRSFALP